ncbi:TetR/AcrR family transcriptional regulator [Cryptosporangium phraense]|uniref:TetR/AcrR family transcriptional regulator n=1 Tax=Cryptosporangium phraense TaxID=2593070 RepID=A0A545AZW5_9ACTN|nr:TetR/AcrR family transcriptional regulator [Cryptosporangium phraense]TQS46145.1 TetR/AcrR family transcriptional regulator [Cryptosporangium phraense]
MSEAVKRPVGRPRRDDNSAQVVLAAAADLFATRGFDATSMRDISTAAGVQPASVYYHFRSKEALLVAIVDRAATEVADRVRRAVTADDPWARLEQACAAHLTALLHGEGAMRVLATEIPSRRSGEVHQAMLAIRDSYEQVFRDLVAALPLRPKVDRRYVRLTLLGAVNWSLIWYRPDGDSPTVIARRIVGVIRDGAANSGSGQ